MKTQINFCECEHYGDLENCLDDLKSSGATILKSDLNSDEEEASVLIEVDDINEFKKRFRETDSYGFSSL